MRHLKLFASAFILLICFTAKAQSDTQRSFVAKFELFKKGETAKLRWTTSPDAPEDAASAVPMPNAVDASKTHVPDPDSGLWHYPNLSKVYDPETGYYIDYDAYRYYLYRADTKTGRIYKGKTPVQIKRTYKVQQ
ncbi:MAG TPA: hypothetical protein VIG72_09675 [Pontibacter sp.]